ncbi:MAG: proline--tRNA ligase [Candidatus Omnitrophica bacterium]|nr:proline--tRNA ligase [Candidatus Omnitrophota bacterium]
MLFSEYFVPTLREVKEESLSFRLSLKAGLIAALASGIYSYLPLGLRVLKKIEAIIRKHMDNTGALEVLLPALQPLDLWKKTQRDELLAEVMVRFQDRRGRKLCLGPTHEEVITDLVARFVSSYKQLPLILYQIQTKFRDEVRPRAGLIRSCEFVMKDAYSFDIDEKNLQKNYQNMYSAYNSIFSECGLRTIAMEADPGFIGGSISHEFLAEGPSGEDVVFFCDKCNIYFKEKEECPQCNSRKFKEKRALELGHIFNLGTKYSEKLDAFFLDKEGRRSPVIMGCYGIGVSRIISAVIEQNCDKEGIIWPKEISPFDLELVCLNSDDKDLFSFSSRIYRILSDKGLEVLFDQRAESIGVKLNDAYLLGMPYLVIVGRKNFLEGKIEIITRSNKERILVDKERLVEALSELTDK